LQQAVQKLDQGDTIGAMLDLEGILARDDEYWPAYFYLGRTQAQLGDDLGAKASFMRAAALDPGNAELHYLVATAAWALADFEAAWNQTIAARQAGYPQAPIDQLLSGLDRYSDPPMNLVGRAAYRSVALSRWRRGGTAASRSQFDFRCPDARPGPRSRDRRLPRGDGGRAGRLNLPGDGQRWQRGLARAVGGRSRANGIDPGPRDG